MGSHKHEQPSFIDDIINMNTSNTLYSNP